MEKVKISVIIGYLFKLIKNGVDLIEFKDEINALKHSSYDDFVSMFPNVEKPFMVLHSNGIIKTDGINQKEDGYFVGIIAAGNAVDEFFKKVYSKHGNLIDSDLSDDILYKAGLYEPSLRLHANNCGVLINERDTLEEVINNLVIEKKISLDDTIKLHNGRKFLNLIKHGSKTKIDWVEEIKDFELSYDVILKHNLTIL